MNLYALSMKKQPMDKRSIIRLALGYLAAQSALLGVWALLGPRSFYDGFPGFGKAWISVDGPYNEHLIRDVGALNLALLVVLVAAAFTLSRQLVVTACLATLAWGVPHLLYHAFNTGGLSTVDVIANLGGLAFFAALPLLIMKISQDLSVTPNGEVA